MSEEQLVDAIIKRAQQLGWRAHHDRPARTAKGYRTAIQGDAGFVDLVLAHPVHGVIFAECKGEHGRYEPGQKDWINLTDARIWRPDDWRSGLIEAILRG